MNPFRTFYERKQGQVIDQKDREFGELMLREVAYGWETTRHDSIMGA
jgi:hypothetical protein